MHFFTEGIFLNRIKFFERGYKYSFFAKRFLENYSFFLKNIIFSQLSFTTFGQPYPPWLQKTKKPQKTNKHNNNKRTKKMGCVIFFFFQKDFVGPSLGHAWMWHYLTTWIDWINLLLHRHIYRYVTKCKNKLQTIVLKC